MKKLFISITAAFVFLLSCIIPFTASADDNNNTYNRIIEMFFRDNPNIIRDDTNNYYVAFEVQAISYDNTPYTRYHVCIIDKNSIEYTDTDGIKRFTDTSNLGFTSYYINGDAPSGPWGSSTSFRYMSLNSNNNIIYAQTPSYNDFYPSNTFSSYESTIEEQEETCPLIIEFTPTMSGDVDRSVTVAGEKYNSDSLVMTVTNSSGYNWAYDMTIYDASGNIVYQFLSYEWENTFDIAADNFGINDIVSQQDTMVQLIGSDWHLVQGGSSVVQRFKWSQIPLKTGQTYTIECYAYNCGTGEYLNNIMLSDFVQNREQFIDNPIDDYFNEKAMLAYSSTFKMLNYDDVVYDHNDTSNGIIPYNCSEDYYRARTTRLAMQGENGFHYEDYSAFDDPNSWFNKNSVSSSLEAMQRISEDTKSGRRNFSYDSSVSSNNQNANYNDLISYSGSYLALCRNVMNYFPPWFIKILEIGLIGIVIVAIYKKV